MHPTRKFLSFAAAGFAAACLCLSESDAATIRLYREGAIPDPAVVAAILGKPKKNRFRGLGGEGTAPLPADGGETLSEDDIRSNAAAAVTAWRSKVGDRPLAAQQDARAESRPQLVAALSPMPGAESDRPTTSAGSARPAEPMSAAHRPIDVPVNPTATASSRDEAAHGPAVGPSSAVRAERRKDRATVLAVLVRFANDSSRLTGDARGPLDAIAAGIKLAGFERKIVVEGHANATGSASYNLKLSTLRAEAVKRYLVEKHGIPAALLVTEGFGSTQPLDAKDPAAGENRRVQFRAVES